MQLTLGSCERRRSQVTRAANLNVNLQRRGKHWRWSSGYLLRNLQLTVVSTKQLYAFLQLSAHNYFFIADS
jgi:hypothetical protein